MEAKERGSCQFERSRELAGTALFRLSFSTTLELTIEKTA